MKDQWILSKQRNVNFFFKNGKGSPITFFGLYDLPQKALIINILLATFIQNQKALSQKYVRNMWYHQDFFLASISDLILQNFTMNLIHQKKKKKKKKKEKIKFSINFFYKCNKVLKQTVGITHIDCTKDTMKVFT